MHSKLVRDYQSQHFLNNMLNLKEESLFFLLISLRWRTCHQAISTSYLMGSYLLKWSQLQDHLRHILHIGKLFHNLNGPNCSLFQSRPMI